METPRSYTHILEDKFSDLLEAVPSAMVIVDRAGHILLINSQMEKLFGYTRGEILGQSVEELVPERFRAKHPAHRQHFFSNPLVRPMGVGRDLHGLRKDGSEFPVEIGLNPLETEKGLVVLASIVDITERKRAEERFRLVVEAAPNSIVMADGGGRIVLVNAQTERLFGYRREELIGQSVETLVPERYRRGHPNHRAIFMDHPSARPMGVGRDLFGLRKDGSEFPVEIGLNPIETEHGLMVLASIVDITERKRAEEILRESEERYRNLFESIDQGFCTIEVFFDENENPIDYQFLIVNPAFERQTGIPNAVGRRMREIAPLHEEHWFQIYGKIALTGEPLRFENPAAQLGRYYDVYGWRIGSPGERKVAILFNDITARKRVEQELAHLFRLEQKAHAEAETAHERLSFLADATALLAENFDYLGRLKQVAQVAVPRVADWCAIDVLESDGSLRRVAVVHSDPARVEWAYELQRRFPPDPDAPRGVYHVLRTGEAEFYPEISDAILVAATRDEEQLELARGLGFKSTMVVPFQARGSIFGAITLVMAESERRYTESDLVLMKDLARRAALLIDNARLYEEAQRLTAELEQRVRERTAELEATNKELEAFSYSVSHDLRAPLRAINGFSQALSTKYTGSLGEQGVHYLSRIQANTTRMGELIDDLLSLSRISRRQMKREVVNLTDLAREIARELRAQDPGRQTMFEVEGQLEAKGDTGLIRIILHNLLSNAWKFTSTRRQAHIQFGMLPHPKPFSQGEKGDQGERERVFFIRDNGVGFDMAFANKLFGAFQRLHAAQEFPGTGIGLATVQRIIHRHGGRIWAEAEVEKGAIFYFTLGENHES
ncbi:MAG TPA: PAS domain S-box protein [Anaerolineales bacterium]|nr:PAS domain S-box protein [Anaerolineales bacterium]